MRGKRGRVERVPEDRPLHDDDGPPPLISNTEPDPHHADPVHLASRDDSDDDDATMEGNDNLNAFSDGELHAALHSSFLISAKIEVSPPSPTHLFFPFTLTKIKTSTTTLTTTTRRTKRMKRKASTRKMAITTDRVLVV